MFIVTELPVVDIMVIFAGGPLGTANKKFHIKIEH